MVAKPTWLLSFTQHGTRTPFWLRQRSSEWFITGTVFLAVFTDLFLYGVIVPVIPFALKEKANVTEDRVQYWVSVLIAIYGAGLLAFSPVCGWLADHSSSRRSPLLIGLFALLGATVLLNIGSNISVYIAGRILQGISAAVVWVVGFALLADTIPQERLAQAMGFVSLAMTLGLLLGPLLGGIVFDNGGYNAVFAMCYGLIGLDIVLRLLLVEKKVAMRWNPDVSPGRVVASAGPPTNQIEPDKPGRPDQDEQEKDAISGPDLEKGSPDMSESSPADEKPAAVVAVSTPPRLLRDRLPPLLSLLYSRRLLAALFASIIQAALLTAFDGVLTIRVARIFNWTATGAALLFLPIVIPSLTAPLVGMLCDRIGGRYPASFGFLFACIPFICLRFVEENTIQDKVLMCAMLALIGITITFTFPPVMAEIAEVVETKEKKMLASGRPGYGTGGAYAQAYALLNVAFAAGTLVGPLIAGALVEAQGWGTMALVLGLLSGVTAVPTFLWLGGWVFGKT